MHKKVGEKWAIMWDKFDLGRVCLQLNAGDFPQEVRDPITMSKAVENFLKFSTEVRKEWGFFSELFCRSSALFVDCAWVLQIATLSHPGHVAQIIKDHETLTDKKELLSSPTSARRLRDFLVAEVMAGNGLRAGPKVIAAPVVAAAPIEELDFNLTDDEKEVEPKVSKKEQELIDAVGALQAFNPLKRKKEAKAIKKANFKSLYEQAVKAFKALSKGKAEKVITFEDLKALGHDKLQAVNRLPDDEA